jgi:hypothetical protein
LEQGVEASAAGPTRTEHRDLEQGTGARLSDDAVIVFVVIVVIADVVVAPQPRSTIGAMFHALRGNSILWGGHRKEGRG